MAKDPQTPLDDELARREQEADAQPVEGELDEALEAAEQAETEVSDNPEAELLAARVEELEQGLAEAKDQALRAAAEAQNVRRRAEQEAEKARKFALEKFVRELRSEEHTSELQSR